MKIDGWSVILLLFAALSSCSRARPEDQLSPPPTASGSAEGVLPRGIAGLQLGMTVEQASASFLLREGEAPDEVATLIEKVMGKAEGAREARQSESVQKKSFSVSAAKGSLPRGVTSVTARFTGDVLYYLWLRYDEQYVKRVGRRGVVVPYLVELGPPTLDAGTNWEWRNARTNIRLEFGETRASVTYVDIAVMADLERELYYRRLGKGEK